MANVEAIKADILEDIPHGFLTRKGGLSAGAVAGLNVGYGSGEDPFVVAENRRLAGEAVLPGAPIVAVHQYHSAECVIVGQPWDDEHRPKADAMATNLPGILLGIVTADCAPVLLADKGAGVVGAAHAGWRGAHDGVLEATVAKMQLLGARADRIRAAIGPAIAQASYEVGNDFAEQFDPDDGRFFKPGRPGHQQFDLEAYVASRLVSSGVGQVEKLGLDTYVDEDRFYSYRRSTHRGEANYGRQFSLIGLAG
ncbi:MAG TPA: peptidoglycan editing factor PgeF [Sphingomonadaceae bacterium]|nr:peptidoglycan editing factor PgeF [Sphingomonadaceae bacterium]